MVYAYTRTRNQKCNQTNYRFFYSFVFLDRGDGVSEHSEERL